MTENQVSQSFVFFFGKHSTSSLPDSITLGSNSIPFSVFYQESFSAQTFQEKLVINICQTDYIEHNRISAIAGFSLKSQQKHLLFPKSCHILVLPILLARPILLAPRHTTLHLSLVPVSSVLSKKSFVCASVLSTVL